MGGQALLGYRDVEQRNSLDDQQWDPSDLFSKGQHQEKTESSLTGLISWNVLEAAKKQKSFQTGS